MFALDEDHLCVHLAVGDEFGELVHHLGLGRDRERRADVRPSLFERVGDRFITGQRHEVLFHGSIPFP